MYVQSHARLWIINNYNNIFYAFLHPSTRVHALGRRKKEKFPNFSSRINITILARDNRKIRRCTTLYPSSVFFTHISYSRLIIPHVTFPAKGKVKQRSKRSSSRINDARRRCNRVPLTQFHWQDLVDRSLQYP